MANWSLPTLTDLYTNFLAYLKARDDDAARLNDSRVTAATNAPDYAKRWNATTGTFQNWLSSAWANLVLAVAGGGTGATTAAGARTNLDVYSKAESDAKYVGGITTSSGTLASGVALTSASTWYDGPSVSLSAGTWLVMAHATINITTAGVTSSVSGRLLAGVTEQCRSNFYLRSLLGTGPVSFFSVVALGATTTVKVQAMSGGAAVAYMLGTDSGGVFSYIHAVKIA